MNQFYEFIENSDNLKTICLGKNYITDTSVEILAGCLRGNVLLNELSIKRNIGITDNAVDTIVEIIKKSSIAKMELFDTSISNENMERIQKLVRLPMEERDLPIKSNAKSAAKIGEL